MSPAPRRGDLPTDAGERIALLGALVLTAAAAWCWLADVLAEVIAGHGWQRVPARSALRLLTGMLVHPDDPRLAWPAATRPTVPSRFELWCSLAVVAGAAGLLVCAAAVAHRRLSWHGGHGLHGLHGLHGRHGRHGRGLRRAGPRGRPRPEVTERAGWASRRELRPLIVRGTGAGRLVIGTAGHLLVAAEAGQSLLVAGPTQCGKTRGLAIPAILEWEGPVVATSVKSDLLRDTIDRRAGVGEVHVYDPTGATGLPGAGWAPLATAHDWAGARALAAGLCSVARASGGGLEDGAFWYATAEKLLAPLLFAAASSGASISDVVRWVDTEEVGEVLLALELAGVSEAVQAARASFGRDDRQRSSVYTTAETVLAAFADPGVARACARDDIDAGRLLAGSSDTLYLVAPAHEQQRLQAVFVALLRHLLDAAFASSAQAGRPLSPPLLVVLDEAANVAPITSLDTIASTAAGHGIQLLTIWQDFAQIEARYGTRAATVVNNHRAKLFCSGIADPATLEHASQLIGDGEEVVDSLSFGPSGELTTTRAPAPRRLVPADALRRIPAGEAVLVYGNLPPARLRLRPLRAGGRSALRRASSSSGRAASALRQRRARAPAGRAREHAGRC